MIRRIINKFFPVEVKIALSYLQNYNTSPYNLNFSLFPEKSISDFFVFDKDCLRIGFIAENIRAMILGQEIPITHNFKFFSMDGVFLGTQSYQTKEFFTPKDRIAFIQHRYNIKPIWYDFEKIIRDFFDEHDDIDIPKSSKINNPVGIFPYFLKDKALSISVSNIF